MTRGLLSANRCPVCTGTFPHQEGAWPTCPAHGHLLYQLRVDDAGWTYTCPAHKCTYTHTQKEQATMTSTNEATHTALAIRKNQELFDDKQKAALAQLGIEGASNADLAVFMHYCQRTGLDPFARQVTMIKRRNKVGGQYVTKWTIQTEIDGFRLIANRAAKRAGQVISYGPTIWIDNDEGEHRAWIRDEPPAAAHVTVYVDGAPFHGDADYKGFGQFDRETGKPQSQWATMPGHMIAKCAEAQALRKAFPNDLAGLSNADESTASRPPRVAVTIPEPPPAPELPRRMHQDPEMVKAAIVRQFDRLDIDTDTDERDIITCRLVGADTVNQLTLGQFEMVLSTLESCDDRTDLDKVLAPDEEPMF